MVSEAMLSKHLNFTLRFSSDADNVRLTNVCIILHSLICRVLLLLLLLLLLRNASDLRNCT